LDKRAGFSCYFSDADHGELLTVLESKKAIISNITQPTCSTG
jgi:hypothetical protein